MLHHEAEHARRVVAVHSVKPHHVGVLHAAERARLVDHALAKSRPLRRARVARARHEEELERDLTQLASVVRLLGEVDGREPPLPEPPQQAKRPRFLEGKRPGDDRCAFLRERESIHGRRSIRDVESGTETR